MCWCFEDQASAQTDAILDRVATAGALVPPLWHLEVSNVLLGAERRGLLAEHQSQEFIDLLSALPIQTDLLMAQRALTATMALARQFTLTAYDAAYLELAHRSGLELATCDAKLETAAKRLGVPVRATREV